MGVAGVILRYAVYYPLFLIGFLLAYAGISSLAGFSPHLISAHWLSMFVAAWFGCNAFARQRRRYFRLGERVAVFFGVWLLDLVFLALLVQVPAWTRGAEIGASEILGSMIFGGVVDILPLLLATSWPRWLLSRLGVFDATESGPE